MKFVHGSVSSYAQLADDAATKLGNKVTGKSANRDGKPYGVGVTDIRIGGKVEHAQVGRSRRNISRVSKP